MIEDDFVNGGPEWKDVGVQFVSDAAPFEKIQIRLLNVEHPVLGFLGVLSGYTYVNEAVNDPLIVVFLEYFMDKGRGLHRFWNYT